MTGTCRRIISFGCAILLLSGVLLGCKKRPAESTPDAVSVAQKKIRNTLDDLFAYIKIGRTEKICTYCEDEAAAETTLSPITESRAKGAFPVCGERISLKEVSIDTNGEKADVTITISLYDTNDILDQARQAGGFSDEKALSEAIRKAPEVKRELTVSMRRGEDWKILPDSMTSFLSTLYGFLSEPDILAEEAPTETKQHEVDLSVYDAYWVDGNKNETIAYYESASTVCLYVYTWNTYSNVNVEYHYEDEDGNLLYSNSFLMKSNTDWIACSSKPGKALNPGQIRIRLFSPSGDEFFTKTVQICKDSEKLPFPVTWMDGGMWLDETGTKVDFYPAEATHIEFSIQAMKFYGDMDLLYTFTDGNGNVLSKGKIYIDEKTDTFTFSFVRTPLPTPTPTPAPTPTPGGTPGEKAPSESPSGTSMTSDPSETSSGPTMPPVPQVIDTITLEVTTDSGRPFCSAQVEIRD